MIDVIQKYFKALSLRNYARAVDLFSTDAMIRTPLYGALPARDFYKILSLLSDTQNSKIKIINVFKGIVNTNVYNVHFQYECFSANEEKKELHCIDIFSFDDSDKIKEITIIYDASEITSCFPPA